MNKRQAKIEALWIAVGVLRGAEMTGLALELSEKDQEKVEKEFKKIVDQLYKRVERLAMDGGFNE